MRPTLSPRWGLLNSPFLNPRLAPWAAFLRRFAAKQFAEKLGSEPSEAKALTEKKSFIAALKALRHPKASFSANCKAFIHFARFTARLKAAPFQKRTRTGILSKRARTERGLQRPS